MKKAWITIAFVIVFIVPTFLCIHLYQQKATEHKNLEATCENSITSSLEYFQSYLATEKESDYIAGVSEFRVYMASYHCLMKMENNANYVWCNALYGEMVLNAEEMKSHIPKLIAALEYLATDYQHPNGFQLIFNLTNQIESKPSSN